MQTMLLQRCLALVCILSASAAQPRNESVFKQLTATELNELDLAQSPALLELAARTGESVVINITEASQGGIVQDGVNVLMDCYEWVSKFTNGTIQWYKYHYTDLDHTMLEVRVQQSKEDNDRLRKIGGQFNRYYNITQVNIRMDRGVYECEVCSARGTPNEECRSANVTLAVAGRPPLLNSAIGDVPDVDDNFQHVYRVGATVCVDISPTDATLNVPLGEVTVRCPVPQRDVDNNIPRRVPAPRRTWTHISLDGKIASLSTERVGVANEVTEEFACTFPGLDLLESEGKFFINTNPSADSDGLIFNIFNMTTDDFTYQMLGEAFGEWTCTVSNALGTENATTYFGPCEVDNNTLPSISFPSVCLIPTSTIPMDIQTSDGIIFNTDESYNPVSLLLTISPSLSLPFPFSPTPTPTLPMVTELPDKTTGIATDTIVATSFSPTPSSSLSLSLPISPTPTPALPRDTKSPDDDITLPPSSPSPSTPTPALVLPNTTELDTQMTSSLSIHTPFTSTPLKDIGPPAESTPDFTTTHISSLTLTSSFSLAFSISPTPSQSLPKDTELPDETTFVINDTRVPIPSLPTLSSSISLSLPISPTPTPTLPRDMKSPDDDITLPPSTPSPSTPASSSLFPNTTDSLSTRLPFLPSPAPNGTTLDFTATGISASSPSKLTPSTSLSLLPTRIAAPTKDIEKPGETTSILSDTSIPTLSLPTFSPSPLPPLPTSPTPTLALPRDTKSPDDVITLPPSTSLPMPISPTPTPALPMEPSEKPTSHSITVHISTWFSVVIMLVTVAAQV